MLGRLYLFPCSRLGIAHWLLLLIDNLFAKLSQQSYGSHIY